MAKSSTPHHGNFVAYYRVSTDRQGSSGLGLDAQRKAVRDFLDGGCKTNGEFLPPLRALQEHEIPAQNGGRSDSPTRSYMPPTRISSAGTLSYLLTRHAAVRAALVDLKTPIVAHELDDGVVAIGYAAGKKWHVATLSDLGVRRSRADGSGSRAGLDPCHRFAVTSRR